MNISNDSYLTFRSSLEWERWLEKHHDSESEVWLRFFKKSSGKQTFTFEEALDVALCFGWMMDS